MKSYYRIAFICLIYLFTGCTNHNSKSNSSIEKEIKKETPKDIYSRLQDLLDERKTNLMNYMNDSRMLAKKVSNDEHMVTFFQTKKVFYDLKKTALLPDSINMQLEKLKQNITYYYIINYQNFYDILFVDTNGDIFYTIKKEADYHKNIFEGELAETKLSKKLKNSPNESFVDFDFYSISGEPSAFFIEPVLEEGKTIGWFVLQLSINKINNLFSLNKNLGSTGEVVLVNKQNYLLTDSRFHVESTILKQKLPKENIQAKFHERKGKKNVTDYRGQKVYTVFDIFDFLGMEWLIIAKIDQSEVLTDTYLQDKEVNYKKLEYRIKNEKINYEVAKTQPTVFRYVDMDEYQRSDSCCYLCTKGVSTCTAVSVTYPGKYTYLVHISPYDAIYNQDRTDLIAQIFRQIDYFDITESERQHLQFNITLTQLNSLENLINKIINGGYFLSQIKVAYNPKAIYGTIYSNCSNSTSVYWLMEKGTNDVILMQDFSSLANLENILYNTSL